MTYKILVINPGSTSTKIGLYGDTAELFSENISHSAEELRGFSSIIDQFELRLTKIKEVLVARNTDIFKLSAVVGRGGLLRPVESGTYWINRKMVSELRNCEYGSHASNLGAMLADMLAKEIACPGYIVDPVVVDELEPVARVTGRPEIKRKSIFHALNQKAVAKRFAQSINAPYETLNLIVAHLGGGISVGCHKGGKVVDVNNALDGEGPFSPERAGTIPAGQFAKNILDKGLRPDEIPRMLAGQGGLVAHLGTNDAREVEKLIAAGDRRAEMVYNAMIYNISRSIASGAVPVAGAVDYILLTGGIAYSTYLTDKIKEYIGFIAPVVVIPGENELQALAEGAYRVLTGQEQAKQY